MPLNRKNKKIKKNEKAKQQQGPPRKAKAKRRVRNRRARQQSGVMMSPIGPGNTGRLGLRGSQNYATTRTAQVIEEDEYVADVLATANNFNVVQYSCNPGQAGTFPWGNRIAQLYEKYEFEYLEFYFRREVSEFATGGTTGKVILSFDFDASDQVPTLKQQMLDTVPHADALPSEPYIKLPIDVACLRDGPARFVRPGAQPAGTDIKTYDAGVLNIATYGLAVTSGAIGELRVRYRVKLMKPVLEAGSLSGGAVHFSSIAATTGNNFAASAQQAGASPALAGISLGSNTLVFPAGIPGNYLVMLTVAGATSATASGGFSFGSGTTALNVLTSGAVRDSTFGVLSLAGTTVNPAFSLYAGTVTAAGSTWTLTPSTIVGTGSMDLFVIALPATLLTAAQRAGPGAADIYRQLAELQEAVRGFHSPRLGESPVEMFGPSSSVEPLRPPGKLGSVAKSVFNR